MIDTLKKQIVRYFQGNQRLSKQRLADSIKEDFPNWSPNTVNMYLSKFKKIGLISAHSRGFYELDGISIFNPKISKNLKRIHDKIKRAFPFVSFCVWESGWLNDLMVHQPFKSYLVVEVEKKCSESVFRFLTEFSPSVFLNPNERIYSLYISSKTETVVIVKNLVSEAPLVDIQNISAPALEKLLVDMLVDVNLFSAQQSEKEFIMQSAFDRVTINKLKMRRYALRRNRGNEIEKLMGEDLIK